MKLSFHPVAKNRGSALAMVLILSTVTLLVLGSILQWCSTNTTLTHRNNQYYKTVAAAEAATEKILTRIDADYKKGGDVLIGGSLSSYRTLVPTREENPLFEAYEFSDGQSQTARSYVEFVSPAAFRNLSGQYRGLYGYSSIFRVISNARNTASPFDITGAVRQDIELTTIPLFQFAIFYNLDLEINPGPVMTVTGPVHGNRNIYLQPQNVLTFNSDVTAAGQIINNKHPLDPLNRSNGRIVFEAEHDSGVSSLNMPVGTNNTPTAVRQIVEPPAPGESATSALGKERFHNKADMIITITGNSYSNIAVTSGIVNNRGTPVPEAQWHYGAGNNSGGTSAGFLWIDSFFNKRENKTVNSLEIVIDKLRLWSASSTNVLKSHWSQGDVTIIYVDDQRTQTGTHQPGVRVRNGRRLPSKGLTVVTATPLYVRGTYNVEDGTGTSSGADTSHTKPAALIGDSITILSDAWSDDDSTLALGSRVAGPTTVNAAILAGIVQTDSGSYSGGVENFPRFLEDWGGVPFTYNGSMVVMYPSQVATAQWRGTGSTIGIYNPPNRLWAFDTNFRDPAKLPPGTPSVRALIRSSWAMVKPNTTTVVAP